LLIVMSLPRWIALPLVLRWLWALPVALAADALWPLNAAAGPSFPAADLMWPHSTGMSHTLLQLYTSPLPRIGGGDGGGGLPGGGPVGGLLHVADAFASAVAPPKPDGGTGPGRDSRAPEREPPKLESLWKEAPVGGHRDSPLAGAGIGVESDRWRPPDGPLAELLPGGQEQQQQTQPANVASSPASDATTAALTQVIGAMMSSTGMASLAQVAQQAIVDQAHGVSVGPTAPTPTLTPIPSSGTAAVASFGASSTGQDGGVGLSVTAEDLIAPSAEPESCTASDFQCQMLKACYACFADTTKPYCISCLLLKHCKNGDVPCQSQKVS
jgi:hypothetical protein